ncbi:MAG: hypothetical protein K2Y39_07715 [Candidatus Obscuribacterales bacterium]|nr:hypothetical protein [Candidatus Obscuribacterales bacterium]
MIPSLKEKFRKIGARVDVTLTGATRVRGFTRIQNPPASLDVLNDNKGEFFQIRIREDISEQLDISVLEVQAKDKHLVLLARQIVFAIEERVLSAYTGVQLVSLDRF